MIELIQGLFAGECYFRTHFHIYCPGCGGTRAAIALLQGNLIQSIKYNPITLLFLVDVSLMAIFDFAQFLSKGKYVFTRFRLIYNIVFLIFIVSYSILRNFFLLVHGIDLLGNYK